MSLKKAGQRQTSLFVKYWRGFRRERPSLLKLLIGLLWNKDFAWERNEKTSLLLTEYVLRVENQALSNSIRTWAKKCEPCSKARYFYASPNCLNRQVEYIVDKIVGYIRSSIDTRYTGELKVLPCQAVTVQAACHIPKHFFRRYWRRTRHMNKWNRVIMVASCRCRKAICCTESPYIYVW